MILVKYYINYLVLPLLLCAPFVYAAQDKEIDLKIIDAKLYYIDNSISGKPQKREYLRYSGDDNWSKLQNISLRVSITNKGRDAAIAVSVIPELYFLFEKKIDGIKFPSISQSDPHNKELTEVIGKGRIWVWNRSLGSKSKRILKPREVFEVKIDNLNLSNPYYAMNYTVAAFAVRVFVSSKKRDSNYSDNVKDFIYLYPM